MPIPFILGGIAVAAGLVGAKKALDASDKNARARRMNRRAQETFENAKKELLAARDEAGKALENLGQAKVDILHGGGTLAAGGLGIAGGTAVLGGLVAGPAIAVMGFMMDAKADKNLDIAKSNRAKAREAEEQMKLAGDACRAIGKRADMFRDLISQVDTLFRPLIEKMEAVVKEKGTDYRDYGEEERKTIAMALATAGAVKAVLDTPILTKEGAVTEESLRAYKKVEAFLPKVEG